VKINDDNVSFVLSNDGVKKSFRSATDVSICDEPQKFIVEYSSPNIAKPFHVGHLRSTIIGNFLANLLKKVNHNVIKMNYLGDYGTQFGFLKAGMDMEQLSDQQIKENPLQTLLRVYVAANASNDPAVAEKARKIFEIMEFGEDPATINQWNKIREYTLDELKVIYERLNVIYDAYEFESMYRRKDIENVISSMHEMNILEREDDGKTIVNVGNRRVTFIKSDSTTLYLTRDIAAFLSRKEKYQMDKTFYVVDNGQNDHFTAIKSVVNQLGYDGDSFIHHVKFGRIRGMSTRKGNIVFLKDILDEAKDRMYKKQQESQTTKVDLSQCGESVADVLGTTAIIVSDLKQRRTRDYEFDWNLTLQVNGDTGIKLQYTHCRLYSLQKQNAHIGEAEELNLELLKEPEAQQLIFLVLRYPEIIYHSYEELESCVLVKYAFDLCNAASRALKTLSVKNCECKETASQRLLLFNSTRRVLIHAMDTLGLKVLNEM
jgi:arginyl-tRNA synthetase